jgi:hypothetical protein
MKKAWIKLKLAKFLLEAAKEPETCAGLTEEDKVRLQKDITEQEKKPAGN